MSAEQTNFQEERREKIDALIASILPTNDDVPMKIPKGLRRSQVGRLCRLLVEEGREGRESPLKKR